MTEPTGRSAIPAVILTLVIVAIFTGAVFAAFAIGRGAETAAQVVDVILPEQEEVLEAGPIVIERIRDLAVLTTVEAVGYTTIEKGVEQGWLTWATGDSVSLFAVARIGAGVDLDQIDEGDIVADREAGSVAIRLPRAEVTYVEVDSAATHVYDRDTGLFTKGDPQLESEARRAAEEIIVGEVLADGLLDRAEDEA
ncbi:MAG: DUF4230 domain-containing protein, partial [Acidimicrobiia bacterium]|nr:DUF4230 domain-containing protein [Acidimicrobiia bacterium]